MGYIIIILLIIIILILVAPVVLGIFGLFIAAIIAAIITYWWVFLIAIVLALVLPSILKISLNSVDRNRKLTKKKKYIILSSSAILLLAVVFGILVNNKIILTYPIICKFDSELTKRAKEKLFNDRGDKINDIIPFGKFRFGMTKNELLDHVRKNRISTEIFFDNFTYSKIRISDSIIELPVKYFFDTKNKLRVVEFELDTSLIQRTKKILGKKYVEDNSDFSGVETTWFDGNQKIILSGQSYSEVFNIRFVDYNYHGILNTKSIYSPLQKLRGNELRKQKSEIKEKRNTFMGFQLGMNSNEVESIKKELISKLIEKDNFYQFTITDNKIDGLKKFKFFIDKKNWVHIEDIMFSFDNDKLYKLEVDFLPNYDSIYNKFLQMYLNKYGESSIKMKNEKSDMQYIWIKDGVEVAFSRGTISYIDIYTYNQKQIALQKIRLAKTQQETIIKRKKEIEKIKIIDLEKKANIEKELKLKNLQNNI